MSAKPLIRLLPDNVANKIAAGEVVQRPSSVVKELIENAVDAKSTEIQLIVKDAGKTLIQVIDNGSGIPSEQVEKAFLRHSTSKISEVEDIFSIVTKGFRGEALASIASVAKVELKTFYKQEKVGVHFQIEGGEVTKNEPQIELQKGSSFSVKHLFYNIPARRNFLKSDTVELRHITDEFLRIALAHPEVSFSFYHQGGVLFNLKATRLADRLVQVFGSKMQNFIVPIKEETSHVKITGYVCKPERAKRNRKEQFFFVNRRYIKSFYLSKAIGDAYENLLPSDTYPSYFLFIDIDPSKIDINIHPTKTEVKFEDDYSIFAILRSSIKHALGQFNISDSLDFSQDPEWAFIPKMKEGTNYSLPEIKVKEGYNPFTDEIEQGNDSTQNFSKKGENHFIEIKEDHEVTQSTFFEKNEIQRKNYNFFQWQNSYIILDYNGQLLYIDQHRAHQKVLYEKFKQYIQDKNSLSKELLIPVDIELSDTEIMHLKQLEPKLIKLGFDFDFTASSVQFKAIPSEVVETDLPVVLEKLFEDYPYKDELVFGKHMMKLMAKGSAIKKGTPLDTIQIQHLVEELFALGDYKYSPFGRKIFVDFSLQDIRKQLS